MINSTKGFALPSIVRNNRVLRALCVFLVAIFIANMAAPIALCQEVPRPFANGAENYGWKGAGFGAVGALIFGSIFGSAASGLGAAGLAAVLAPALPWLIGGALVGAALGLILQGAINFGNDLREKTDKALGQSGGQPAAPSGRMSLLDVQGQ